MSPAGTYSASGRLSDCSQKYKGNFKRLGTESVDNIPIDRASSGMIKKSLIKSEIVFPSVPLSLPLCPFPSPNKDKACCLQPSR